VACHDVVIRYGDTVAVDRLSFEARTGEVLALLGPNGAGKTSTVEALEGYRRIDGGTIGVLGLDPQRDHAALVSRIGVMLQRGGVYPMLGSVQVLRLFARYYEDAEDPEELIDRVGLSAVSRTPYRRLSGGEQQRLSLALALVGRPKVLFLDEPTAGVDPEGRLAVRSIIAAQRDRGICVILTTHELAEAERLADHVVIIDHGQAVAAGSPGALTGSAGQLRFRAEPGLDTDSLLAALPPGSAAKESPAGHYLIEVNDGVIQPALLAAVTAWCADRSVLPSSLRIESRTLEDVFLELTGRDLRA